MAKIYPFAAYRYNPGAGDLGNLVTQPYDKISPAMQRRYLSLSPYNLVRVILGEKYPDDTESNSVYTRAAGYLNEWIAKGVLQQDTEPSLYAYSQEFTMPDTGETLVRKGFIGAGAVEDYAAGVVYRHEKTLSGPKKDRLELLEHTRAHFGQIFMLYPDREGRVDAILDEVAATLPVEEVTDEYNARHRVWKISDSVRISRIQELMSDKKLLIADGHHRYETALAFSKAHPELKAARNVMMTLVNMYSEGLRILATHRLIFGLPGFQPEQFLDRVRRSFAVRKVEFVTALQKSWAKPHPDKVRIGVLIGATRSLYLLEKDRAVDDLDVKLLHEVLLEKALGIDEEAVREQRNIKYVRGVEPVVEESQSGSIDVAFLLEPTSIEQVASVSFGGGVMPQKSTDFYPKLLSGLTMYKIDS